MRSSIPVYSEVQPYRELPPFTLLAVVGTLFGWFLILWVVLLNRELGSLVLPPWLALAIGLPLGILLPLAYLRMQMVTEVHADRVLLKNGMTGQVVFPLSEVVEVDVRNDDIHSDYNVRNVGTIRSTRTAYTVATSEGVELALADGRRFLIGSKNPQRLGEVITSAWRGINPEVNTAEA